MGLQCSKLPRHLVHDGADHSSEAQESDRHGFVVVQGKHVPSPALPLASSRRRGKRERSIRRSILRMGSRILGKEEINGNGKAPMSPDDDDDMPGSPRARANTYSHVHDTVMYNLSEAEMSKHDQSVPMGVIGLRNLGNTCYINSSLQCLSSTIPLTDYFLGYDYRSEINQDNFLGTGGKLATAYSELMKQMWLGRKSVVDPTEFKRQLGTFAPQFNGFHQHDAQELLSFLLDGIHEDLNRVKEKPYVEDRDCDGTSDEVDAIEAWKNYLRRNRSLIVDLFQGQFRNTCKCLTCGHVNIRFEPFMYLSLPMSETSQSIKDCMDLYLDEEVLQGEDQWYCEKCKTHRDATKKIDLWILPPILIVHLKRFRYNDSGQVGSKNDASIQYSVTQWDLKSRVRSKGGVMPVYDLYAVSNHMGGLGGGHYTACALNRFDDVWYEFNDSSYRSVDASVHQHHQKSAYLLFYNRSEGDITMPLNERSPVIRRQSVSRPELWPHQQVDDRAHVRDFTRCSMRRVQITEHLLPSLDELEPPNFSISNSQQLTPAQNSVEVAIHDAKESMEAKEDLPARVASFRRTPQDPPSATATPPVLVPEADASKTPLKQQPMIKKNGVNGAKPTNGGIKLKKSSSSEKPTAVKSTNGTGITQ
jgi:ubiquitin carboxyl-terminal hydrolase 8